ncbi:hypothetical protein ASPZODRAFT_141579 [Penicilliopsis zonata CBS 506.65]|uniref:Amino acid transporter transmembrane domain-containing protein n=1 Tax=Penicilliopsis zonata CBS 506.65 TaxID=1073090 RepID=A0A1L9SLG2_9EURO|nr:hypothetical protein ASPZODRAFT_141579 [Penicilliopsis zonata CBS 506.65]OJJ48035.1 hypothetical protein ASPZODRAFT_141579 [Penicilliopsis zonata CBS 506.65]
MRLLHDTGVTFEEYQYYAARTRAEEDSLPPPPEASGVQAILTRLIPNLKTEEPLTEDTVHHNVSDLRQRMHISDEEWANASRAVRTASAGAVFYLITTDILGPFSLPYALATTGWGFSFQAWLRHVHCVWSHGRIYSGYLLWSAFMGLDSHEFPLNNYGDIAFRVYGHTVRHVFNFLQVIQLIFMVSAIIISNGQALSEAAKFNLCYAVCCLVWALIGFFLGQIRTLRQFSWLPVQTSVGLPNTTNFSAAIVGLMQAVYAYGGAMIFVEFMSELRQPRDFLKGMWSAQLFIYLCYMVYGMIMYHFQGQYCVNPSYLSIPGYSIQTAGNVMAMVSALIAAILYGNIGAKAITSAVCILQFSYTFPPFLHIAYNIQRHAVLPGEGFDPATGQTLRHDGGLPRIWRGFFAKYWYVNVFNVIYFLGALATAGIGIWSAIEGLIEVYAEPQEGAFVCHSPLE